MRKDEKCLKKEEHKPEECTPEQIRACQGDVVVVGHTCIKNCCEWCGNLTEGLKDV